MSEYQNSRWEQGVWLVNIRTNVSEAVFRAFSGKVDAGFPQENATNQ
jgi:hypothetical protein